MVLLSLFSTLSSLWEEIVAAAVILTIGWAIGKWKSEQNWRKKEFKNRILLSLNSIKEKEGKKHLILRTMFEDDVRQIFHSPSMVSLLMQSAKETKVGEPIVPLPKEDAWYILNAILNHISERYSNGTLKRDMGADVVTKWYTFCITFEREGEIRMQKIRIMFMEKEALENFPEDGDIQLESPKHKIRIDTLRHLKHAREKTPHLFMDIELNA